MIQHKNVRLEHFTDRERAMVNGMLNLDRRLTEMEDREAERKRARKRKDESPPMCISTMCAAEMRKQLKKKRR